MPIPGSHSRITEALGGNPTPWSWVTSPAATTCGLFVSTGVGPAVVGGGTKIVVVVVVVGGSVVGATVVVVVVAAVVVVVGAAVVVVVGGGQIAIGKVVNRLGRAPV